jgi:hypothetical protein
VTAYASLYEQMAANAAAAQERAAAARQASTVAVAATAARGLAGGATGGAPPSSTDQMLIAIWSQNQQMSTELAEVEASIAHVDLTMTLLFKIEEVRTCLFKAICSSQCHAHRHLHAHYAVAVAAVHGLNRAVKGRDGWLFELCCRSGSLMRCSPRAWTGWCTRRCTI